MNKKKTEKKKSEKPTPPEAADYALQIYELYQNILGAYAPVEKAYRAAVKATSAINGFSSSTNL